MKKVLIWDEMPLSNTGGPSGYCYNIHEYLKSNPCEHIDFLSDIVDFSVVNNNEMPEYKPLLRESGFKDRLRRSSLYRVFINLNEKYTKLRYYFSGIYSKPFKFHLEDEILNSYSFIHVHYIYDVFRVKKYFPNFKGKIIMTTHCPCPWMDEIISWGNQWMAPFRSILIRKEYDCYRNVDYLMFPCKDAREPYEKDITIKEIFKSREDCFFYVPTSITDKEVDYEKMQRISDYGIPQGAFVIIYIGRHSEIKGYDILKSVANELLDINPNLYFLCAGKGAISPLSHPRWIELGFINNAAELLAQSDLYILPNRETYFDLVTLEILRSGTVLVMSNTGGNRYFGKLEEISSTGIRLFDLSDTTALVNSVNELIKKKEESPSEYAILGQSNRELFRKYFTVSSFVKQYVSEINQLN